MVMINCFKENNNLISLNNVLYQYIIHFKNQLILLLLGPTTNLLNDRFKFALYRTISYYHLFINVNHLCVFNVIVYVLLKCVSYHCNDCTCNVCCI